MHTNSFVILIIVLFVTNLSLYSQVNQMQMNLDEIVHILSLKSTSAKIERLKYQNDLLQFENYKKGLLPSISFNLNPINLNRSLRLLQQPTDGSYSYIEDYSNNSALGISLRQKIGLTGGDLNISSRLNYLNEFSEKKNSFSTSPFVIGYSQQLWGGAKNYKFDKRIEYAKNEITIKKYCSSISKIQQEVLGLFMNALFHTLEYDLTRRECQINDTLLNIAKIKLRNGHITEYDLKQIELQSLDTEYAYETSIKNKEQSQRQLLSYLGIECDSIEIVYPVFNLPMNINIETVTFYVRKNNPFAIEQRIAELEAEKALHTAKLDNRFNATLSLNYGINQYAETFVGAYRHGNTQQSIMLGLQIPIFQWGIGRNKIKIARNNYEVSKLNRVNSFREFENEIKDKTNNYNQSIKLWQTSEIAYKLSQEQYRMLVKKFSLGKVSVYELVTVQRELNNAMQRYYSAIRDVYNEYFSLRHLALYDWKKEKELKYLYIDK